MVSEGDLFGLLLNDDAAGPGISLSSSSSSGGGQDLEEVVRLWETKHKLISALRQFLHRSTYVAMSQSTGGFTMSNEEWVRVIIEKLDQDRRESEQRAHSDLQEIRHLIERQNDHLEATRREIREQGDRINSRIDQAYTHFQNMTQQTRWASIGTFVSVAVLVLTFIGILAAKLL